MKAVIQKPVNLQTLDWLVTNTNKQPLAVFLSRSDAEDWAKGEGLPDRCIVALTWVEP